MTVAASDREDRPTTAQPARSATPVSGGGRCVLWLPRQAAVPTALINGLSVRRARILLFHDAHEVMADLLEHGPAAVIIHAHVPIAAARELLDAVSRFVPRTTFRAFAPHPAPGRLHRLTLAAVPPAAAPAVAPPATDPPSSADEVREARPAAAEDEADSAALVDGPWPLRPRQDEPNRDRGGIASLMIRLADQARAPQSVGPQPRNGYEPLLSREELAMLLGPREDDADDADPRDDAAGKKGAQAQ